jgi:undecaprenyl diphosphate synthase
MTSEVARNGASFRHVAIIPDGNRRWARARGMEPWEGHEEGAKNTEALIREARRLGIREVSIWGSSMENMAKRPLREKQELLRIWQTYFTSLLSAPEIHADRCRVRIIGHWREQFPASLVELLSKLEDVTADYDQYYLNFFLAYSGDDDMLHAVQALWSEDALPESIATIKSRLSTAELPPVDLLIRTGGEPHLSAGFLMLECANSQLAFPSVMYPDFGVAAFGEVLDEVAGRERRLGK